MGIENDLDAREGTREECNKEESEREEAERGYVKETYKLSIICYNFVVPRVPYSRTYFLLARISPYVYT